MITWTGFFVGFGVAGLLGTWWLSCDPELPLRIQKIINDWRQNK